MSFTVTHTGGISDRQFEAYVRLLDKHGVKLDQLERVPEPGTRSRWLNVWSARKDAEAFRDDLIRETRSRGWHVHELTAAEQEQVTVGPLGPINISVGRQGDGWTFGLHPQSLSLIRMKYPDAARLDSVFVGFDRLKGEKVIHQIGEPLYNQVATLLTGLSERQLDEFGGYYFQDAVEEKDLYRHVQLLNG